MEKAFLTTRNMTEVDSLTLTENVTLLTHGVTDVHSHVKVIHSDLLPSFVYVCLLALFGIPGNTFVCLVYQKKWKRKRKPSTLFILTLSWFDLANCLSTLPFEIVVLMKYHSFDFPVICKISRWITFFLNCASSIVLLGIAVDRFIGIRCHLRRKPFGISQAKAVVVCSVVVSCFTCWPSLVLYGTSTNKSGQYVEKKCLIDDYFLTGSRRVYPFAYCIYLIVTNLIVDAFFITLYSLIGRSVYVQNKENKRSRCTTLVDKKRPSHDSSMSEEDRIHTEKQEFGSQSKNDENEDLIHTDDKEDKQTIEIQHKSKRNGLSDIEEADDEVFRPDQSIRPVSWSRSLKDWRRSTHGSRKAMSSILSSFSSSRRSTVASIHFGREGRRFGPIYHTRKTTFMLFMVTLVYVLTFVPYCVIAIIRIVDYAYLHDGSHLSRTFYHLFVRSYMLSMAVNPIIYSFMNRYFRQECIVIIKRTFLFLKRK